MLEKEIEKYLVKKIKEYGGLAIKLNSTSMAGLPDRLLLLPNARIKFVELKQKNKKPRTIQKVVMGKLHKLGFDVLLIDDVQEVDKMLARLAVERQYSL